MTKKNLKLSIKNTQIAKAVNLQELKDKLAKKKAPSSKATKSKSEEPIPVTEEKEEAPRIRARSKSAFAEPQEKVEKKEKIEPPVDKEPEIIEPVELSEAIEEPTVEPVVVEAKPVDIIEEPPQPVVEPIAEKIVEEKKPAPKPVAPTIPVAVYKTSPPQRPASFTPSKDRLREKLGPTGKHISDLLPSKYGKKPPIGVGKPAAFVPPAAPVDESIAKDKAKARARGETGETTEEAQKKGLKGPSKFKEFRDIKSTTWQNVRQFDARDRMGLGIQDDAISRYRKKRPPKTKMVQEDTTIRPSSLSIRVPISIKDLAAQMKLKSSQLIAKLLHHGSLMTINDFLEDDTTLQLLGQDFGCAITIDRTEEDKIRITDKSIQNEISATSSENLKIRAPVVAFMGHVDHGKTSLIDCIRKSNIAAGEAGAITQHIGAFRCHTNVGDIAILDTPGHEAFSAMRSRGATVTDIVVLVVAGDEGIMPQTIEALNQARDAGVNIVVAINKCDKPSFDPNLVYRQLADNNLLPESWGGQTITVNCSAKTGEGIPALLEMLALQAEVLELRANPSARGRGTVLESEMHKGMGSVSTVLVQNGTLRKGDAIVSDYFWGRVKTMRDEHGRELIEAGPSTPIEITGLSGLPSAGNELFVVKSEKEAREIAEARQEGMIKQRIVQKRPTTESLLEGGQVEAPKKIFKLVVCADVQGSLEALKTALQKIKSQKIDLDIVQTSVGEVSESIIEMAAASDATILGFHTIVESHAETVMKQRGVTVKLHDIIYHAIDDVKEMMRLKLDKIAKETEQGKVEVRATFKSSHLGVIAGCYVTEGVIHRSDYIRVMRNKEQKWKGPIGSLKRVKDDVREVQKGLECGIHVQSYSDFQVGDILEAYEVTYIEPEL